MKPPNRFLTPQKIALLAIADVYALDKVPTAATIPVLSLLVSHILPPSATEFTLAPSTTSNHSDLSSPPPSSPSPRKANSINIPVPGIVIPLLDFRAPLHQHQSSIPGRSVWDLVLRQLWASNCLDNFHRFFAHLPDIIAHPHDERRPSKLLKYGPTSPIGMFIRRCHLEFARLGLEDILPLWKAFIAYRHPTASEWRKRSGLNQHARVDEAGVQFANLQLLDLAYGDLECYRDDYQLSEDDIAQAMEFAVSKASFTGLRADPHVRSMVDELISTPGPASHLASHVKWYDALLMGDPHTALDHLHRYFDHTMNSRQTAMYHWALVGLADVKLKMGSYEEALTAMEEAITTAREYGNTKCLNYALTWLFRVSKEFPEEIGKLNKRDLLGKDEVALSFLKSKAGEGGEWSMLPGVLLLETQVWMNTGKSPVAAFENLIRVSHLNITNSNGTQFAIEALATASLWHALGVGYLAKSTLDTFQECHSSQAGGETIIECTALTCSLLIERGRYEQALSLFESIDPAILANHALNTHWTLQLAIFKWSRALVRHDLEAARHFRTVILANIDDVPSLRFPVTVLQIRHHALLKDLPQAFDVCNAAITRQTSLPSPNTSQLLELMILKSDLWNQSGNPAKGLSNILRACTLATQTHSLHILFRATVVLCKILTALSEFQASEALLLAILPQSFETENCVLIAELHAVLADTHMGFAGTLGAKSDSMKRKERMAKALTMLDHATAQYARAGDVRKECEMWAKRAFVLKFVGDPVLAEDCAGRYLACLARAREDRLVS